MTKELQDLAWAVLPKEFKEEVNRVYDNSPALGANAVLLLENLFGIHNLTSDAEAIDLEPYTESTDLDKESSTCTNDCPSQCKSQDFYNIIKDGFRGHNRLHIAAMAMQGILSNTYMLNKVIATGQETIKGNGIAYRAVAEASFLFADAIISQSQKTSSE